VLLEKFTLKDVMLIVLAIVGALVASAAQTADHALPLPTDQTTSLKDAFPMSENTHFMVYMSIWIIAISAGLVTNFILRSCSSRLDRYGNLKGGTNKRVQRFTLPVLSGYFYATWQILLCLSISTVTDNGHLKIAFDIENTSGSVTWSNDSTDWTDIVTVKSISVVLALVLISGAAAFYHFNAGTQLFECRYFTTTALCVCIATMQVTDVLFSRKWVEMSTYSIITFCLANFTSVISAFLLSAEDTEPIISTHGTQGAEQLLNTNSTISELETLAVSAGGNEEITRTCWYQAWFAFCRWLPMLTLTQVPIFYAIFFLMPTLSGHTWFCFTVLTVYSVWATYQFGLHMVIFSLGGQSKIEIAAATDFKEKWAIEKAAVEQRRSDPHNASDSPSSGASPDMDWDDVYHVVVLANYKEHLHIMREALDSLAASPMAQRRIIMVLACEEREAGASKKADTLIGEYRDKFKHFFATHHPDGMPGEVPSKASNMHWATARVSEYINDLADVSAHQVLMTTADADSEFHPKHFDTLTEAFLSAGSSRDENIWQPPMLHFKNYHEQPGVLRLASQFTSVHELANLADPMSVILPYSTYTVPLRLLQAVGDFDPDWLSEDWHIGLKCRLATMGRCRTRPIFTPVVNYAPEDETYVQTVMARWQQSQRHALGFTELSYVWASIPLAWASLAESDHRVSKFGTFIWQAVIPLSLKILGVHSFMATLFCVNPLNNYLLYHYWTTGATSCIGSWTYMINFVASSMTILFQLGILASGVFLYEQQKSRIVPARCDLLWASNKLLHFLRLGSLEYFVFGPMFFVAAGVAEWMAAMRGIGSHKFLHDVALKPSAESLNYIKVSADDDEV